MSLSVSNGVLAGQAGVSALGSSGVVTGSGSAKNGIRVSGSGNSSNNARKKKLNYNPREISQQILRASKALGASQVLIRARMKVGVLERCRATGQYEDAEIRVAMAHARRMVKCARMKVNNLKVEEHEKKQNQSADEENGQQKAKEVKRRARTKKQQLKRKAEMQMKKLEMAQQARVREEALNHKRRLNRNKEREEIVDAEMKYLQGDTGNEMDNPQVSYSGVIFEASAQLAQITAQMAGLDNETERAVEQELAAADMAADAGTCDLSGAAAAPAGDAAADVPADAVSIDVSV